MMVSELSICGSLESVCGSPVRAEGVQTVLTAGLPKGLFAVDASVLLVEKVTSRVLMVDNLLQYYIKLMKTVKYNII